MTLYCTRLHDISYVDAQLFFSEVFMIFLGIDVSKFKHNCFLSDGDNFDMGEHFEIKNSREGFDFLIDKLSSYDRDNIRIGLEYTGNYHLNLSRFLLDLNFNIQFFNPFQTCLFRRADSFRNTKTDKVDAFFIAKLLKTTCDSNPTLFEFYHNYDLKSLCRYKSILKKDRSRLKNSIVSFLDIVFPELCNVCNDVFSKYVLAILYEFSSAYEISRANITRLSNLIKNASRGAYSKDKALIIRDAARNSIGYFSYSVSFQLKQSIDYLYFLDRKIDEINVMIKPLLDDINSPIMSIPGIGIELGPTIISEIGDINRFDSSSKLLAYVGLDPSINQSGTFHSSFSTMSKRGSSYLRDSLFKAAFIISQIEPVFKEYYLKKKAEGKHHYVALTHVARKLVRVIFYLLKENEVYVSKV